MRKAIGILGGMGPQATLDLQQKIIDASRALRDQDHCDVWVANLASIPARVAAIESGATSPLPAMRAGLQNLVAAGAGLIVMPCNTAHYWYDDLTTGLSVPFIHIADAAVAALERPTPGPVAVLGTSATLRLGMYQERLAASGRQAQCVANVDAVVADVIHKVKVGDAISAGVMLAPVIRQCLAAGAARVVLACTELPVAAAAASLTPAERVCLVDPTRALAEAAVAWWRGQPA